MILLTNKSFGYMCFYPSIIVVGGLCVAGIPGIMLLGGAFAHWWGHGKLVLSEGPDKEWFENPYEW